MRTVNVQYSHSQWYLLPKHLQAGVKHVILAVSYRAELLEKEMKEQESRVSMVQCMCIAILVYLPIMNMELDNQ